MGIVNMMIVGDRSDGKTVALCCTYYKMMESLEKREFDLTSCGDTAGRVLEWLSDVYGEMMEDGKFPEGTVQNKELEFYFQKNEETICKVVWLDPSGEYAINSDEDTGTKEEIQKYRDNLKAAALEIYIVPGNVVYDYIRLTDEETYGDLWDSPEEKMRARRNVGYETTKLKAMIERSKEIRSDRPPIVFYMTKADYIKNDLDGTKKIQGLKKYVTERFHFKDRAVLGCYSTVGTNVYIEDNRITSGFEPKGFEIPLMLTVGYRLSENGKKWDLQLERLIEEEDRKRIVASGSLAMLDGRNGLFDRLRRIREKERQREEKERAARRQEIKDADARIADLKVQRDAQNQERNYADDICRYLSKNCKNMFFYLDPDGKEKELSCFFQ